MGFKKAPQAPTSEVRAPQVTGPQVMAPQVVAPPRRGLARLPRPVRWLLLVAVLLGVWYGAIGTSRAGVKVDLSLRPSAEQLPPGGSVTLGMTARLLEQQVEERAFTPNDQFFYPTGLTRRTPAFQAAVVETLASAVDAMAAAGGSDTLASAAEGLNVPPSLWWVRASWPPVGRPAERHYREARLALQETNRNLADRQFEHGSFVASPRDRDAVLRALLADIEAEIARGDELVRNPRSTALPVQIARARGTAYAATIVLRGLSEDSAAAIRASGRAARWGEARDALDSVARLDPLVPRSEHLLRAGYSLLMAESAIRSILEGQG